MHQVRRAARYSLDILIGRHGPGYAVLVLLRVPSADCPKRASVSAYDLCGVHCPELSMLFLGRTGRGGGPSPSATYDHGGGLAFGCFYHGLVQVEAATRHYGKSA
jgi:hypothetical protein